MMKKLMFSMMSLMVVAGSSVIAMNNNRHAGFIGMAGQSSSVADQNNSGSFMNESNASAGAHQHKEKHKVTQSELNREKNVDRQTKNGSVKKHVTVSKSTTTSNDNVMDQGSYANSTNSSAGSYNNQQSMQQQAGMVAVGSSASN